MKKYMFTSTLLSWEAELLQGKRVRIPLLHILFPHKEGNLCEFLCNASTFLLCWRGLLINLETTHKADFWPQSTKPHTEAARTASLHKEYWNIIIELIGLKSSNIQNINRFYERGGRGGGPRFLNFVWNLSDHFLYQKHPEMLRNTGNKWRGGW